MFGGLVPLHASITTMLSLSCGWSDLGNVIIMRDSVNFDKHFFLRGGGGGFKRKQIINWTLLNSLQCFQLAALKLENREFVIFANDSIQFP